MFGQVVGHLDSRMITTGCVKECCTFGEKFVSRYYKDCGKWDFEKLVIMRW